MVTGTLDLTKFEQVKKLKSVTIYKARSGEKVRRYKIEGIGEDYNFSGCQPEGNPNLLELGFKWPEEDRWELFVVKKDEWNTLIKHVENIVMHVWIDSPTTLASLIKAILPNTARAVVGQA